MASTLANGLAKAREQNKKMAESIKALKVQRREDRATQAKLREKVKKVKSDAKKIISEKNEELKRMKVEIDKVWDRCRSNDKVDVIANLESTVQSTEAKLERTKIRMRHEQEDAQATIGALSQNVQLQRGGLMRLQAQIESAECSVCFESFVNNPTPRMLFCGHSVCESCLQVMTNGVLFISCPVCRAQWDVSADIPFPTNFALLRSLGH